MIEVTLETETQEQDIRFGNAVRTRRTQLGVTLDQLAETSGVSAAALSRVERGLLSPSLRNALAIARGLGCELSELVERESAEIIRAGENLRFYDEATGIERLALARPSPDIELLAYTVPPGAVSSRFAAHKPGSREIFHILSGRLEIHAQETVTLETGDTVVLRVDCEHWFANVGDDPVRLILTILSP
ncbi:helix-turn-helix domain-containing protein [Shinella sp. M27]|uniref:helix-turn-helix domain-containing protein n=1 Tax=Shinella sp. M27 TaxID=3368614 RepID=UPI003BA34EE1